MCRLSDEEEQRLDGQRRGPADGIQVGEWQLHMSLNFAFSCIVLTRTISQLFGSVHSYTRS